VGSVAGFLGAITSLNIWVVNFYGILSWLQPLLRFRNSWGNKFAAFAVL